MPGELYALGGTVLFGTSHLAVRRAHDLGWNNFTALLTVTLLNELCYILAALTLALAGQLPTPRLEAAVGVI